MRHVAPPVANGKIAYVHVIQISKNLIPEDSHQRGQVCMSHAPLAACPALMLGRDVEKQIFSPDIRVALKNGSEKKKPLHSVTHIADIRMCK